MTIAEKITFQKTETVKSSPTFPTAAMNTRRVELTDFPLTILEGTLPKDLNGHAFIMGPTGFVDDPDNEMIHPSGSGVSLFNGDGTIYRFDFDRPGEVQITTKLLKTPCYYADLATDSGTKYANLGFTDFGLARLSQVLGFRNELNTAFLPFKFSQDENWRLLVTWDAGRPYEVDPVKLQLITPIGSNEEWRQQKLPLKSLPYLFPLVLSGAHPIFDDRTDELFMLNWGKSYLTFLHPILIYHVSQLISHLKFLKPLFKLIFSLLRKLVQFYHSLIHLCGGKSEDFVYLMCWNGEGMLQKWQIVSPCGLPLIIDQSMHQIGITQNYVVLMDTAFKIGAAQVIPNPAPQRQELEVAIRDVVDPPQSPNTIIYLVPRDQLQSDRSTVVAKKVIIPREIAHFMTDYDDADGKTITLHAAHNSAWDPSEWLHDYDRLASNQLPIGHRLVGMTVGTTDLNSLGRYTIDTETGKLDDSILNNDPNYTWAPSIYAQSNIIPTNRYKHLYMNCWGVWQELTTEFIYDLYKSYPYRQISPEAFMKIALEGKPTNICHLDTETMEIVDGYYFPTGYFGDSPQFIPRSGNVGASTDDGYVLCNVLYGKDNSEIWIFDAKNLAQGPICKLGDPTGQLKIGLTIHSTWLPSLASPSITYHIPVQEDYDYLIKQQDPNLRAEIRCLFQEEIYPHFDKFPL